ncbi:aminotransferase class I/II-fold pyridoxal phosphate-dependent enzyme [Demequina zhanjiangensis]|uniref:Aminotransferase n=1 Tax=Demequina zhanjiangensis TaxID=3051659 RepID=A0ABT8G0E4_9MICO|nr:aminotransferase class I/II-fold pyridoxal phosphate-dependent enzyme [Demequina sp. SYSU T00b26]MDN4472577.1 aminotransferase class I/II-fold pyridoxal phosphate-dependent enzyme [Demequina sp. SYSU T00b26]
MRIAQRALDAEPFHAMALIQNATAIEQAGHRVIRLNIGEPSFGAPESVRKAMVDAMDGRPLPYSFALGMPALRERISWFYKERHGVDVDPARIAITSGASSALLLVTAATVDPGADVLLADPSYPCNREIVTSFGGNVVAIPTSPATRYQLTAQMLEDAWTDRTQAVMVATPSNPTGTSLPTDELAAVCDLAKARGAWRIVDEIYLDLADPDADGTPPQTVLAHDAEAIVVNSFSKYFGMTGWRLGWVVLPESLVKPAETLAMDFFLSASTPAQIAALACFEPEALAEAEARRVELVARRQLMVEGLARIGLPVDSEPDGAFYAYPDVSPTGMDAWTFCERALTEAHVALTPGKDFGETHGDTHVRLSYASSREDIVEGIDRLGRWLDSLPPR